MTGKLTKSEVAEWIRDLIPYLKKPVIISPSEIFEADHYEVSPGKIINYGDVLTPTSVVSIIHQTENLKILKDLYISLDE